MENYVRYASITLFILASHQVYLALGVILKTTKSSCGCEHDHAPTRSLLSNCAIYSLFIFPLLLGFLLPDTIMASKLATTKGMNLSTISDNQARQSNIHFEESPTANKEASSIDVITTEKEHMTDTTITGVKDDTSESTNSKNETVLQDQLFVTDEYNEEFAKLGKMLYKQNLIEIVDHGFMEVLTTVYIFKNNFLKKELTISGFVYRNDDMKPNQFVVSRLAMSCCAADAEPYGFMVEFDNASAYATDSWVHIRAHIGKTIYNDYEIVNLEAIEITSVKAPATPYVYPDYEYLDEL